MWIAIGSGGHQRDPIPSISLRTNRTKQCLPTCGVPQGSMLGPLLCILYVNDICNVSKELLPILFADDTNVFINGTDVNYMLKNYEPRT